MFTATMLSRITPLKLTPALLVGMTPFSGSAAELNLTGLDRYTSSSSSSEQVTSINQFSDLRPSDRACPAAPLRLLRQLRSLRSVHRLRITARCGAGEPQCQRGARPLSLGQRAPQPSGQN